MKAKRMTGAFPALVQNFFVQRLIGQRDASPHTVASYRDMFRLLFSFLAERTKRSPAELTLADFDAPVVLDFLDYLEKKRGNSIRSRNARLAAIRSFMHYVSFQDPAHLPVAQRVLAIPFKRFDRPLLGFLSKPEMDAVIEAPDRNTWSGQRDHVMLATMYNTGARVSEIARLHVGDVLLDRKTSVHIHGKGRKERKVPLWRTTSRRLKEWLPRISKDPEAPLFPNRAGKQLTRAGIEHRLRVAVRRATARFPKLENRRVSPHTIRHTTAMHLLQSVKDITVVAMWLGHAQTSTTHQYVEADLDMKERALKKLQSPSLRSVRYKPSDHVLTFLESL